MWQRVDAHPAPWLHIELVCGGIQYSGYRYRPPDPPRERLQTPRRGQLFGTPLGYLKLFTWQSTAVPQEVPVLEVRERPPSILRNIDDGTLGGAGAGGPGAATINAKKHRRRPPAGAGAGGPGAPTINAKKRQRRTPGRCRSWRSGSAHH
jgi:hypothetical protein